MDLIIRGLYFFVKRSFAILFFFFNLSYIHFLKELVIETGLPYPTLSNLIDRGEAIGVIERIKSTEDGRARKIQLTPFGENQIMPRIFKAREEADQVLTSNLSSSEKSDFLKLILKITNSLKSKSKLDIS